VGSIVIKGDTSGSITVEAPSVAGTHTLTLPKATGNIATDATVGLGTKNLVINGDMRIAQRGTSDTGNTGNGYLTVDRFAWYQSATLTTNHSQSTDVPTGQGFAHSWKIENTTAFSPTANQIARLDYRFEGQSLQHLAYGTSNAKTMTLSFWVKSSVTGTAHVWLYQTDSGSPSVTSVRTRADAFTINSANTWEKKTITIEGDTSGQIDNDNDNGFYLIWVFGAGSDYTSGTKQDGWYSMVNATNKVDLLAGQTNFFASANQTFYLTGVQLELGENATPFEHRMYGTELALCQRYYCKSYDTTTAPATNTSNGINIIGGSTQASGYQYMCLVFPQDMRATPSITFYRDNGADNTWEWRRSGASGTIAPVAPYGSMRQMQMYVNAGGSYAVSLVWGHWVASAEL